MHPLRIAILIFVIGASVANLVAAKLQHEEIGPVPAPWHSPHTGDFFADAVATPPPEEIERPFKLQSHREANERALLIEVLILTASGIAWFVVPLKRPSN